MSKNKVKETIVAFLIIVTMLASALILSFLRRGDDGGERLEGAAFWGLPVMDITLNNTSFERLIEDKTVHFGGNEVMFFSDGNIRKYDNVEIKGRGNSTWETDKKPFQVKFEKKTSLFDSANVKKWILISNSYDASQMRNNLAFYLGGLLNMPYMKGGGYLELIIDGEYQGLYYAAPKIQVGKNAVDVRSDLGILVELDNLHGVEEGCYYSREGSCLIVSDLEDNDNGEPAIEDFLKSFNEFERATKEKDYNAIKKVVDVESFAKYFVLSEFVINPDAYVSSWYMYKDGLDDKIHVGSGWDYDFAFGNRKWIWNIDEEFYSPEIDMVHGDEDSGSTFYLDGELIEDETDFNSSRVLIRMMRIPQFREEVKEVFNRFLKGHKKDMLNYIRNQAEMISSAVARDNKKWNERGFRKEVDYLLDWVGRRYDHFEKTYGDDKK